MTYDFDHEFCRQSSDSEKWNTYPNALPMWIADSDFKVCPEIMEALQHRLDHACFGYGFESKKLKKLIQERMARLYHWDIDENAIVFTPGVVPALNISRLITGGEGDESITASPAYPNILNQTPIINRTRRTFSMKLQGGRYTPDFEQLDAHTSENTQLLILGNPHNPVGTCYNNTELEAYAERTEKNDWIICSDEIHADLVLDDNCVHRPIATLSKAIEARTITLMAASKTFNIAGFNCAYAIIPNAKLRQRFKTKLKGLVGGINVMGYVASEAAYEHGDAWLSAQRQYLKTSADYLYQEINAIEGLHMTPIEATFLAWIDARALQDKVHTKLGTISMQAFFLQHGLALSAGEDYGSPGFIRLNFACPKSRVEQAVKLIQTAIATL